MTRALFAYQRDAADAIGRAVKTTYNAMEPGLGKSAIACTVASDLSVQRGMIGTPKSGEGVWRREIKKWWPDPPPVVVVHQASDVRAGPGVFIVPYSVLSVNEAVVAALRDAPRMDFSILDEAHNLKNAFAKRTLAVLVELRRVLGLAHPMSGTPAPNHLGELWPILRAFRPDLIPSRLNPGRPMSQDEFEAHYLVKKLITTPQGHNVTVVEGSQNVAELRERCKRFFLRETKKRVLKDLPPLLFDVAPLEIANPEQFRSLGQLLEDGVEDEEALAEAASTANATLYAELGLAKAPAVADYVTDLLEGGVKQIVVWAVHHAVIDHLCAALAAYGVSKYDGRDSTAKRDIAVEAFLAGKHRVFVGQIVAGGTVLTLMGGKLPCHNVVFAESSFSALDNYQAACRIHRIGQHDAVLARFASAVGTYDERIGEITARKAQDFATMFDHQQETKAGVKYVH